MRHQDYERADRDFTRAATLLQSFQLPVELFEVQVEQAKGLRAQGRLAEALDLSLEANSTGRAAVLRVLGGGAEVVAAEWRR